jgi:hypothetical protein
MTGQHDLRSLDPKLAAKQLRSALKDRNINLSHDECLGLVARELGLRDGGTLAAMIAGKTLQSTQLVAPPGWSLRGIHLGEFDGGLDWENTHRGKPVFWLRNAAEASGQVLLGQIIRAKHYAGQRVRFSGWMQAETVDQFATIGLWAFDDAERCILFNNLAHLAVDGALRGAVGWSWREIVKNVPAEAGKIQIDCGLVGRGHARFADLKLEIVGPEVPETRDLALGSPVNLDFTSRSFEGAAQ